MYIKFFKRFFCLFFIIVLLASCDGKDCIEADDFGEYNTDILTIDAKDGLCNWEDNSEGGSGSETVAECLNTKKTTTISTGSLCSVVLTNTACSSIKDCLIGLSGSSCLTSFTYYGGEGGEGGTDRCHDIDDSTRRTTLERAYNICMEECMSNCLIDSFMTESAFEPNWLPNSPKTDSGGYGIEISPSQIVNVQVLGSISLFKDSDKIKTFSVTSKKVQSIPTGSGATYFYTTGNISPTLTGKWCMSNDPGCPAIHQVGEFGNSENISARLNFLRRGVLMVNNLPNGGLLSSYGVYTGPDQEITYNYWECSYDESASTTTCATNYPDTSYKSQNDSNYAMNNSFVKIWGGKVVPESVNKFVLNDPFSNVSCSTVDNKRKCVKNGSQENLVSSGEVAINSTNMLDSTPYFLGYSGGIRKINISSVYPIKLAFAMINGGSDDKCTVGIAIEGSTTQNNTVEVKANGKWFFAEDENGSVSLFNKSKYNTLKIFDTYHQDLSSGNAFNLSVLTDSSQTWKDGNGNDIACGDGMAVFILPQNEVLINKSGFVSFKNLLGNFVYCSGTVEECAVASAPINYNIKFDIINPMYNFRDNPENTPLLDSNFYEYLTSGSSGVREVSVPSGTWSPDVFVRKGQILRFDESNWFNLSGNNMNGFTISRKLVKHDNIYSSTADGLVLRVEARPALLCSSNSDTAAESVDNPLCNKIYNTAGEITCQAKTYSELCVSEGTANYCPLGCYCTEGKDPAGSNACKNKKATYIGGADNSIACVYIAGVSQTSCNLCNQAVADSSTIQPKINANVIQCYDLENYFGAVKNLTNLANTALYSSDTAKYGKLTTNDYLLGARKLGSIFDGGTYGNLDRMTIDTSYRDPVTGSYSEFRYDSPSNLSTSNKNISFFAIENSDFNTNFSSNYGTDMYNNNDGEYKFIISTGQSFNNGEQLGVALALKGWNGDDTSSNFKKWVIKYDMNKSSSNYGNLDNENSLYRFDSNGYIINKQTSASNISIDGLNVQGLNSDEFENLRLYFKIIDKQEEVPCGGSSTKATYAQTECKCKSGINSTYYMSCADIVCGIDAEGNSIEIETNVVNYCVNSYYNNDGTYSIKLRTPKDFLNTTGYIVKYVMKPILEVIDGKNIGLYVNNNGEKEACTSSNNSECNMYFPEFPFDPAETRFGNKCTSSDSNCYKNCSTLATNLYKTNCEYFNNGGGFLQRFYIAVISDNAYQTIVKLCFTLMIMFYGMYYLMGMADLTHGELVKRIIKIGFIYLMIGDEGWKYYNMYFVKFFKQGVDYIVFAVAGAFDQSSSLTEAFVKGDFYDKSVLFSGVDKNLSLLFSDSVSYKIWGLFFVSFFGWLYVFIIYSSIFTYIFSVANALLLYLTAQFFLSLLLAFGPIFFVLLIFEKTKEMFNKWMNNLISFALEQIFLLTCLSLFNLLVYNIIKFVLSYRVCWKTVWELNLPLLGSLQLMSFWKATTATSASAAATAVPGLFQILLIYLIADLMSKFIEFATDLGTSIGGAGVFLKTLSKDIKDAGSKFYNEKIERPMKAAAKDLTQKTARKLIGYKTAEEEKKEDANSKIARKGLSSANIEADKALAQYKRINGQKLLSMGADERNKTLSDVRMEAFKKYYDSHKEVQDAAKAFGVKNADDFAKTKDMDLQTSRSLLGLAGKYSRARSVPGVMQVGSSLLNSRDFRFGALRSAKSIQERMAEGKTNDGTYNTVGLPRMGNLTPNMFRSEAQRAADHDYESARRDLEGEYGSSWLSRLFKGNRKKYNAAEEQLKSERSAKRDALADMPITEEKKLYGNTWLSRLFKGNRKKYNAAMKQRKASKAPTGSGSGSKSPASSSAPTPSATSRTPVATSKAPSGTPRKVPATGSKAPSVVAPSSPHSGSAPVPPPSVPPPPPPSASI